MGPNKPTTWDKDTADALRLAQQLREYHHKALWEEEKHFTWLLSIVLAAQAAIVTKKTSEIEARAALLIVLSIVGLTLVAVALRVVRREGAFFVKAHRLFVKRFNLLFPESQLDEPGVAPDRNVFELPFVVLGKRASIRDSFQFIFLVFGAVNAVLLIGVFAGVV